MTNETEKTVRTSISACAAVSRGIGVLLTEDGALVAAGPLGSLPSAAGLVCLVNPEDFGLMAQVFQAMGIVGEDMTIPPEKRN